MRIEGRAIARCMGNLYINKSSRMFLTGILFVLPQINPILYADPFDAFATYPAKKNTATPTKKLTIELKLIIKNKISFKSVSGVKTDDSESLEGLVKDCMMSTTRVITVNVTMT